jgi:hypothetical protein
VVATGWVTNPTEVNEFIVPYSSCVFKELMLNFVLPWRVV